MWLVYSPKVALTWHFIISCVSKRQMFVFMHWCFSKFCCWWLDCSYYICSISYPAWSSSSFGSLLFSVYEVFVLFKEFVCQTNPRGANWHLWICRMMATNYIGAFCLTKVLLPLLENSPVPSRVVNFSSFTHWNGKIWLPLRVLFLFLI